MLNPHSTLKYLRLVGEYALYSEVMVSPAETGENGRSSIAFFAKDDTEAEMEIVLGSWVSDAILQGWTAFFQFSPFSVEFSFCV